MEAEEKISLSERLFSLGIKPHLKGYAYLLAGAQVYLETGSVPDAHELAGKFGVDEDHIERVLQMCLLLARSQGRAFESADALIAAVAAG